MKGVSWAAIIWAVLWLAVISLKRHDYPGHNRFHVSREQIAIVLVLLGTHSIVGSATAEEVLQDPAVMERIVRGALAGLGLITVVPMIFRHNSAAPGRRYSGLLALSAYWGIAAVSVLYSVARVVTIGKALELAAGMAIVWAIALQPDARQKLRSNINFVVFLEAALVGVAVIGFFVLPGTFSTVIPRPGFIFEATMFSPYSHSNALSASGGLIAAYSLAVLLKPELRRSKAGWIALFVLGTLSVMLASGRQGVVIWSASVMLLLWLHRRRLFLFLLAPAVALVFMTYGEVIWSALVRIAAANIITLSGRIGYWEAALDSWALHPFTGYGFGAGGRFVALSSIGAGSTSHLHSGYMEALVGLGIIGLIPLAIATWRVVKWSAVRLAKRIDTHLAILIVPLLLHTSVSQGFGAWLNADFLLFALLVTLAGISAHDSTDLQASKYASTSGRLTSPP